MRMNVDRALNGYGNFNATRAKRQEEEKKRIWKNHIKVLNHS